MSRLAGVACACALVASAAAPPAGAATHDWTHFGFDAARSGVSTAVAGIGAADLPHLTRQDVALPGTVDSSPLYLHDVEVAGRVRDVFLVSTSYGRAVAIGARTGSILWTYTPPTHDALAGGKQYTTGSPVVDRRRGFLYVPTPDGRIRKLVLTDGSEVLSGGWPAAITRDPTHEKISASLNLSHGFVIATTAGYGGDIPPYQGHVALVNRDTGALEHVFNSLCSRRHFLMQPSSCKHTDSGIWGRSGAVVVPGSHRLLVTTGNAEWNGATNWGDSVLELEPDATRLVDFWTPTNQGAMKHFDVDLGSTAPALLHEGGRWLAVQGGKDGNVRLLDLSNLNGRGRYCQCLGGELQTVLEPSHNIKIVSAPAAWRHGGHAWAFVTTYESTHAFRVAGDPPRLHPVWRNARGGSSPVIAGGLMYVYDPLDGGVAVYRPATGKLVGTLPADPGHWNSPIVADGRVAIPVGNANLQRTTGTLTIYRKGG